MNVSTQMKWNTALADPSGSRASKPRTDGKTMVIDKGLGLHAFEDLLQTSADYVDLVKIGFGTSPLYPRTLLENKIRLAKEYNVCILPGGTFLETAIYHDAVDSYFENAAMLGFTGIEVSDGTIEMTRQLRNELITRGIKEGYRVFSEYGKKSWGSAIEIEQLADTVHIDTEYGAELVIIEGRESGKGVGIYDENGNCSDEQILILLEAILNPKALMWEAPLKSQQVHLMKLLGSDVNLGNISSLDILAVESLRRGLRSDTFCFRQKEKEDIGS